MVPVPLARPACWGARGLRLITGLAALALALSAGHLFTPGATISAPAVGVSMPALDVSASAALADRPGERLATPPVERAPFGGAAWTHPVGMSRPWITAPTLDGERGVDDASRTANEAALDGPVGQRAPPRG